MSHDLHYSLIWISSKSFHPTDICLSEKRLVNKKKNNWKRKLIMTAILIKTVMFFWKLSNANLFNIILRRDFNVFMSINWNAKKVKATLNKINMSYCFTKLLVFCTLAPTWIVFHIFGYTPIESTALTALKNSMNSGAAGIKKDTSSSQELDKGSKDSKEQENKKK